MIEVRKFVESDAKELASIYYNTIHKINSKDYSHEQVNAWAPKSSLDHEDWMKKWKKLPPFVAVSEGQPVGFTEFDAQKEYIDCFYAHPDFQGKGVGRALIQANFDQAKSERVKRIWAEVSITARPFFEAKGFKVIKEQMVTIRGVELKIKPINKKLKYD